MKHLISSVIITLTYTLFELLNCQYDAKDSLFLLIICLAGMGWGDFIFSILKKKV